VSNLRDHEPEDHTAFAGDDSIEEPLDDGTVDAIMAGDPVDPRFDHLVAIVEEIRALGDRPPPPSPSPTLAALIARGGPPARRTTMASRPRRRRAPAAGSLTRPRVVARLVLGTAVGAAGVATAGAAGALPEQANHRVREAIEAMTPFDFDKPADDQPTPQPSTRSDPSVDDTPGNQAPRPAPDEPGQTPVGPDATGDRQEPRQGREHGDPEEPSERERQEAKDTKGSTDSQAGEHTEPNDPNKPSDKDQPGDKDKPSEHEVQDRPDDTPAE
jgi:hypothetical protein